MRMTATFGPWTATVGRSGAVLTAEGMRRNFWTAAMARAHKPASEAERAAQAWAVARLEEMEDADG